MKHIPVYNGEDYAFEGITILDREGSTVDKFKEADTAKDSYTYGSTVTIGELFAKTGSVAIKDDQVQVFVSPADDSSTVGGIFTPATADADGKVDWTKGTLTFTGTGAATISITDYYYCKTTTINVDVIAAKKLEIC